MNTFNFWNSGGTPFNPDRDWAQMDKWSVPVEEVVPGFPLVLGFTVSVSQGPKHDFVFPNLLWVGNVGPNPCHVNAANT